MNDKNEALASGLSKMTHHEVAVWRVMADAALPTEVRIKAMVLLANLMEHGRERT